MRPGDPATAAAVERFGLALLDRLAGRVAVVKPQIAFFEALGWPGMRALANLLRAARERDLLVLLDAKRGDVGSTAAAYAAAYLGDEAPLPADALTLNPYLGLDSLEPFLKAAESGGHGLFVLARTSNPGARDFQERSSEGRSLSEQVAVGLSAATERLAAPRTGWSSLGLVVGATAPEVGRRLRELLPRALFLVPGYGAQGAQADAALAGFLPGPEGLEGGVVNSSRAILFPPEGEGATRAADWERAVDAALARAVDALRAATGRKQPA